MPNGNTQSMWDAILQAQQGQFAMQPQPQPTWQDVDQTLRGLRAGWLDTLDAMKTWEKPPIDIESAKKAQEEYRKWAALATKDPVEAAYQARQTGMRTLQSQGGIRLPQALRSTPLPTLLDLIGKYAPTLGDIGLGPTSPGVMSFIPTIAPEADIKHHLLRSLTEIRQLRPPLGRWTPVSEYMFGGKQRALETLQEASDYLRREMPGVYKASENLYALAGSAPGGYNVGGLAHLFPNQMMEIFQPGPSIFHEASHFYDDPRLQAYVYSILDQLPKNKIDKLKSVYATLKGRPISRSELVDELIGGLMSMKYQSWKGKGPTFTTVSEAVFEDLPKKQLNRYLDDLTRITQTPATSDWPFEPPRFNLQKILSPTETKPMSLERTAPGTKKAESIVLKSPHDIDWQSILEGTARIK
jgi:hypothetical protein